MSCSAPPLRPLPWVVRSEDGRRCEQNLICDRGEQRCLISEPQGLWALLERMAYDVEAFRLMLEMVVRVAAQIRRLKRL
jgi:hypothetical protein